ncbi:MAG: hypothetical protein NC829_02055, partial [Candidatus Omnitrophica bacterium]|nr:hypothetical protein [Candidatus Omnitrophota bacterium]
YAPLALSYVDKLFSETQTEKIIDEAIRAREERDRQEPIKEQSWPLVNDIVSAFNSAVKSMHMYQRDNEVTQKMLDRCFATIKNYFKLQYNLTFSNPQGETKDSTRFLINGQEFPETGFVEKLISKQFVGILRDFDIGSITFRKTLSRDELERFIIVLADEKMFREKKENWQKIFSNNKITSIKIDEVIYRRVLTEEEKKEFHKEVLKDLLARQIISEGMIPSAATTGPVKEEMPVPLERKVRRVSEEEKNILAKTIARLPAETVVETIANEYTSRKSNIQDLKDMVLVCLANAQNRTQLVALLREYLKNLGMSSQTFEWLIDEADFLKYPVKKRANVYLNADAKSILEIGVEENLKTTLSELFSLDEEKIAQEIINKYLDNLKNPSPELRAYMSNTIQDIVDTIPEKAALGYTKKIVAVFLEALENEKEDLVYEILVKNIDFLIYKLQKLEDYQSIDALLAKIKIYTDKNFLPEWKRIATKKAMQEMDFSPLNKHLVALLDKAAFQEEKNKLILGILKKLIPQSIPYLLDLLQRRASREVPFEWYQQDLAIIQFLKENKEDLIPEIENLLSTEDKGKIDFAFYLLNNFCDEGLLYLYERALGSEKDFLRKSAINALIDWGTAAALGLVEEVFLQEGGEKQKEIILSMGEHSHNQAALDFLLRLKDLKSQARNRKEIQKAIALIQKRI